MNDDQATNTEASAQEFISDYRKGFVGAVAYGVAMLGIGAVISHHFTKRAYQLALIENSSDEDD